MSDKYLNLFHKLHCILRNGELGLTGLSALNEINNIIFYIFIESCDEIDISDNCKFSYFYNKYVKKIKKNNAAGSNSNELYELLKNYNNNFLKIFYSSYGKYIYSDTNSITAFRYINKNNEEKEDGEKKLAYARQLYELIKETKHFFFENNKLTKEFIKEKLNEINYDILGDAYEKFKEDEVGNQGKRTGQYFTPRCIIKYIIEQQIKPKDNEIIYDSSCGTGGFIHYSDKYNNENNGDKKFRQNIYGNDKNSELIKPLYINMFLHNIPIKHILNRNSLSKQNCKEYLEKFDVIIGNPPFGVNNKIKKDDCIINEKNYWIKIMHSGKEIVKDSMGQFIIHTLNSLKKNGRFSLVMDRGILNNGIENNTWQKKLRQFILTICEIESIILLPKGIFAHTKFDTAIMHGYKRVSFDEYYDFNPIIPTTLHTQKIKIYIGKFEDETNNTGLIIPDNYLELSIQDIINKNWSLKYDDYIEKKEDLYDGIKYETLDNICKFKNIETLKDDVCKKNGKYPYYNSSIIEHKLCDIYKDDDEVLIINKVNGSGKCKIFYQNGKYSSSSATIIFKPKEINIKYLIIVLKILKNKIEELYEGQDKKSLKLSSFKKFKIPILPKDHQQRIVKYMDKIIGEDYNILDKMISEFNNIDIFKFLLNEDYSTMEYCIETTREIMNYETRGKRIIFLKKDSCFKLFKSDVKMLGEVCEFQIGFTPSTKINEYYGGNILWANVSDLGEKYINNTKRKLTKKALDENKMRLVKKGTLMMSFKLSIGKVSIANKDMYCNEAIAFFNNFKDINKEYLYYTLNILDYDKQKHLYNSQISVSLNKSTLSKLKIPVPSIEDQEKIVSMIENIEKEESQIIKSIEGMKNTIQCIYDSIDIILNDTDLIDNESDENINIDEDYTTEEEKEEKEDIQYT